MSAKALQALPQANSHTIQTDWNQHVLMSLPALLLNHVCNRANLVARQNDQGAYDFYAHRPIGAHDELTFDYETTEYELQTGFECQCGDEQCRGHLKGFRHHGSDVVRAFGPEHIAPYLRNDWKAEEAPDAELHG